MTPTLAETVALLDRLVAFPTVSADSNLALIDDLADRLDQAGARVELHHSENRAKANLFATIGPDEPGGLVLSGHTDVVPVEDQDWTGDPFGMRRKGRLLYGRGTCDMKGFIAAATVMAPNYAALPLRRPIHFAFTYDEEVGCLGARSLLPILAEQGLRPAMALIGEPTSMQVIEGHKGCCEYSVHFEGYEGHGSRPELGVNAVEYAVRYVARLMSLRGELEQRAPSGSPFSPPWSTINVGAVQGGVAHNVIAGKARVDWEMRPVRKSDAEFVKSAMATLVEDELLPAMRAVHPDSTIVTDVIGEVTGLDVTEENAARELVFSLLGTQHADVVSFGTEAGLYQDMGVSAVLCGPGDIAQAHKPDEFVSLDQLDACLGLLEKIGERMAEG